MDTFRNLIFLRYGAHSGNPPKKREDIVHANDMILPLTQNDIQDLD